jgi:3D (Asp-Asp-Asp) domain-containing protein
MATTHPATHPACGGFGSRRPWRLATIAWIALLASPAIAGADEQTLEVTASAYNSLAAQTHGEPNIGAWGDRLVPGMKSIAVSRDLMELGLTQGVLVRIDGLPGEYQVLDKMAKRWKKKVDIYMGEDRQAALDWGVRKVTIRWNTQQP